MQLRVYLAALLAFSAGGAAGAKKKEEDPKECEGNILSGLSSYPWIIRHDCFPLVSLSVR